MNQKTAKILYYVATGLMSAVFLFSASMYLLKNEMVQGFYVDLGFPIWMIYPLAFAKILAVVAIWTRKSDLLKEWAYAGLFFDAVMAIAAHLSVEDGGWMMSGMALLFVVASRALEPMAFPKETA